MAKARFSEVVEKAIREGPQHITRRGGPAVVVVAEEDWRALGGRKSFAEAVLDPSVRGLLTVEQVETLFARDRTPGRDIEI